MEGSKTTVYELSVLAPVEKHLFSGSSKRSARRVENKGFLNGRGGEVFRQLKVSIAESR